MFDIQVFQWHVSRGFIVKNPILWFLSSPSGFIVIEWKKWVYLRIITESLLQHHCIKQLDLDLISSYWTNRGLNLGQYLVIFDTTMLLFLLLATFVACTKKCGVPETKFHRSRSVRPMAEYKRKGGCEKFCYSSRGRRRRSEFGGESTTLGKHVRWHTVQIWLFRSIAVDGETGNSYWWRGFGRDWAQIPTKSLYWSFSHNESKRYKTIFADFLYQKILTVGECETEDELVATVGHVTMFEDDVEGRLQTRKVLTETQKIDGTGRFI